MLYDILFQQQFAHDSAIEGLNFAVQSAVNFVHSDNTSSRGEAESIEDYIERLSKEIHAANPDFFND